MAVTQFSTSGLGTTINPGTPIVQLAQAWGNWYDSPHMQPLQASVVAAPSIGQATFLWRYGSIRHENQSGHEWVDPLGLAGYFARVVLYVGQAQIVLWCGIIQDQEYHAFGSSSGNPSGDQVITAYTLDWCLDRISIVGAWTTDGYVNACPQFNLRRDWIPHPVGNRATNYDDNNYGVFGPGSQLWTAREVIYYLLWHYVAPAGLNVSLGGQVDALEGWHSVWPLEGLTVRQALDKLIDRRRGLGWRMYSDGYTIEIVVYTTIETTIQFADQYFPERIVGGLTLPEQTIPGATIHGNTNQIWYSWNDAILVSDPVISSTESNRYDSIIVQGARMMSTFTASTADGTLVPMWTEADETLYKGIYQEDGPYKMTSDTVRAQDRWRHIYQLFGIRHDWDWTINGNTVAPSFDSNAYILDGVTTGNFFNDLNRPLQRITRLPRPYTAKGPFAGQVQYMEPQVFATPSPNGTDFTMPPNTTLPGGKSVIRGDLAGMLGGMVPSFSVTMADIAPAIELNAGIPHIMGAADYKHPDGSIPGDSLVMTGYDWRTILATLCIETDVRPTVYVDLQQNSPWQRTLHIEVPHAEFWWLTAGTVVYQNNDLSLNIAGGYATRDDTQILRNVAALAKAWYGVARTPVSWSEKSYLTWLSPGMMITSASASVGGWMPINTVISAVTWDFQAVTTHVQTGFGELDTSIVLDINGMSDFKSVGIAFNRQAAELQQVKARTASIPVRHPVSNNNGGSLTLAQVTAHNSDGTVNVDLYAAGTFDATGTAIASTGSVKTVIPEYFSAPPDVGAWLSVVGAGGNYYTVNAPAPAANTGILADFFVEMFDRPDSGVLNGNWSGTGLASYIVKTGILESVAAGTVNSAASINSKNYIAKIALTCQPPPAADGNGYINTGAHNSYNFKFGDGGLFGVSVSLWTANSAASLVTRYNSGQDVKTAFLALKAASISAASAHSAVKNYVYGLGWVNAYYYDVAGSGYGAVSGDNLTGYANSMAISYGYGPNSSTFATVQSMYINADTAAGLAFADSQNYDGAGSSYYKAAIYWRDYATGLNDSTGAAQWQVRADQVVILIATAVAARAAVTNAYNAAVAARTAHLSAIANLEQSTYCDLSITQNSATVASLSYPIITTPQTLPFALTITAKGNTLTATVGSPSTPANDQTITYTDISVARNCAALSITGIIATNTAQIDSIKVYNSAQSEPPNQSGYGKYVAGARQYKDKYHTAIKDSSGVITGYNYNPDA